MDYPVIAVAQLDLTLEKDSRYIMTTPIYHFTYSDGVHLTAPMSRLYGEYAGYVMYKVMVESVKWKPIHPRRPCHRQKGAGLDGRRKVFRSCASSGAGYQDDS